MAEHTFSERLANGRRRRGLSIEQVSSSLRIRPAILISFETGDFQHMPLKGHARNMVSSYARFLGLDPVEVTEEFLLEYRDFENSQGHEFEYPSLSRERSVDDVQQVASIRPLTGSQPRETVTRHRAQGSRSMWSSDSAAQLNRGYDSRSPSVQRTANASARRQSYDGAQTTRSAQKSGSFLSRLLGPIFRHPLVLLFVLVVVLAVLLIGWAVLANSCKQASESDVLPVTGVSSPVEQVDPDVDQVVGVGQDADDAAAPPEDDARYGPFTLVVEVPEGSSPWLEVTVDGVVEFSDTQNGPWQRTWTVTQGTMIAVNPLEDVRVLRNGVEIAVPNDEQMGIGILELQVETRPTTQDPETSDGGSSGTDE
ncbi:MAG: helix-turn-helix domain-containing protein [Coriobacteriales bacterium]|jgi:hypothetical protein|nr:helix-turn-helix domain-containing protein [Coriobacteriales bacterium]